MFMLWGNAQIRSRMVVLPFNESDYLVENALFVRILRNSRRVIL